MPVPNAYGTAITLWSNADSEGKIEGLNSCVGLNVDQVTSNKLGGDGICSGIAISWLFQLLSKQTVATKPTEFLGNFTILRFQGSYVQELDYDVTGSHKDAQILGGAMKYNLKNLGTAEATTATSVTLPSKSLWGAVSETWGHSIGLGHSGGSFFSGGTYYMMDPNFGLFIYKKKSKWIQDYDEFARVMRIFSNQPTTAKFKWYLMGK